MFKTAIYTQTVVEKSYLVHWLVLIIFLLILCLLFLFLKNKKLKTEKRKLEIRCFSYREFLNSKKLIGEFEKFIADNSFKFTKIELEKKLKKIKNRKRS